MIEAQSIPWKRLSVEAFAIVASILLAFSIDAWWDDRQQRNEEQTVLQALLIDLHDKRNFLANKTRYNEAILESTKTLQRMAAGVEKGVSESSIDRLIGDVWWYNNEAGWESAPMTQLIASGGLSSIENTNLAQRLAELQLTIGIVRNNYRTDQYFHHNELTPFLTVNANLAQIVSKIEHEPGNPQNRYAFGDIGIGNTRLHSELLSNTEFQNLLIAKMEHLSDILRYGYVGLDDQLQEIISMLEAELDE
jgi:hypothetical protein